MQTLLAVIDDLWRFAYQSLFGVRLFPTPASTHLQATLPLTPALPEPTLFPQIASTGPALRPGGQYFIGELQTYLYTDPVIGFDTAKESIAYGQTVLLEKVGGRWAEVNYRGQSGWLLKDVLRERREDIHPRFMVGMIYEADNPETIKLRACIEDQFGGARAGLMLSSAEYVSYKLKQAKRSIDWHNDSPRIPGTWQKRLRGQSGIHISISPHTGAVMEYVHDDTGYLAYVEAVFPDSSIKISTIGNDGDVGRYSEAVLSQETYKELHPVFIEVG